MKNDQPMLLSGHKSLQIVLLLFIVGFAIRAQDKETLENKIPTHLPIKIEILYGEKAEVLENAEIKVTNTGNRPIFYLDFIAGTGKNSELARNYGISWLRFGRIDLRTLRNLANSDDPSLKPGEQFVFRLEKKAVQDFRQGLRRERELVPKKYELIFQVLSFGDGTGFSTTGGIPYPGTPERPVRNATDRRVPFF